VIFRQKCFSLRAWRSLLNALAFLLFHFQFATTRTAVRSSPNHDWREGPPLTVPRKSFDPLAGPLPSGRVGFGRKKNTALHCCGFAARRYPYSGVQTGVMSTHRTTTCRPAGTRANSDHIRSDDDMWLLVDESPKTANQRPRIHQRANRLRRVRVALLVP
jgi:hypothetical protein